jgi:hypothetical protein
MVMRSHDQAHPQEKKTSHSSQERWLRLVTLAREAEADQRGQHVKPVKCHRPLWDLPLCYCYFCCFVVSVITEEKLCPRARCSQIRSGTSFSRRGRRPWDVCACLTGGVGLREAQKVGPSEKSRHTMLQGEFGVFTLLCLESVWATLHF